MTDRPSDTRRAKTRGLMDFTEGVSVFAEGMACTTTRPIERSP
jgi:hypothetical protein